MSSERPVRRCAVNLLLDAALRDEVRRLRINISNAPEGRLRSIVRAEQEARRLEENQEAIASIESFIDRHGIPAGKLRYRPA
jgi:antitoxin CcdA